ncbi:pseudouridine-5'-phosphate glycosidase [Legionella taurinensis]|uniref:Pseudouridine-5'-phosphate glycosidase n=1 Tax=Legionella taurinensis TaxID=70611 RepID=A0A378LG03_9GAMM|nr:pseudouridine-5'-phosphate glycosidase [Legionella taurinensis]MDX1838064.1 pseudouridine-5'-phosphate glycosidase [Legionella taurinensis]PUT39353.1 pseudouridine-5-phosphate glycosidase [Legionella taurinensis]PUT41662.1 pseudouridine-5-phosphate glycosidase [Legionella taurinensis]PUT44496.1 pseudouridine-5-phosphate glycosidase [Legionella taurinensis]PUT46740.1 pseudouridine-5-phosphate glycosidase [Legionella taurinensis]
MFHELLNVHSEVFSAIAHRQPVVVLESTIISHGMPYPDNLATARLVEQLIREEGAIPATIALHRGKIHIGIDEEIMDELAQANGVMKASRRDLAYVLSQKLTASTTVAATMYCAYLAGLPLFATGGIGGVHQEVQDSFDISADIIELSSTPMTVVCSGAKSILDLPKTLEMLETHGVAVVGYQTDEFPAFYSHSSGIPLVHRLDSPEDIADMMHFQRRLNIRNGIVVANPIPKHAEIPDSDITPIIEQAHREAQHIQGKAITPYLLQRISDLTAGRSLNANIELIKNNAILGAKIAIAYQNQFLTKKS